MKNRTKLFYFLVFSLVFSGSVFHAFSAPPSSYYYSGQTLDPSCSPGDTNCSASILEIRDSGSNVTYNGKKLDFTGTGVTATESNGVVTVAIPGVSDPEVGVSEVNGGSSGRVFFIGSDSTLASSSGMTYNDATDTLSITRINMPDTGSGDGVIYLNDERFIFGFPNSGSLPYLTFIGYQAGDTALSSGVNQTVGIGYQAGTSLTVSGTNTYIGYKAGTLNAAAAIGSTIIGANASTQNASQPYVTAIGRNALSIDSGAQRSVAIGSGVDENTTNADYDAVLGYNTFNARVNGTQNTALGALVAPTVTNTSSTNIIGYKAGNSISSSASTNHIIMGYQAGDNITTASKTIIIGYDIDGITINGGNYITIGNMIYGTSHTATATTISTGSIGIGDSSPDYRFDIDADVASYASGIFNDGNATTRSGLFIQAGVDDHTAASTSTLIGFADGDGTTVGSITFGSSATAYNTTSDRRLKENIVDTDLSIDDLMNVQVRDFTWKADSSHKLTHGFIAQELYDVYPLAVTLPNEDDGYYMVDYSKLTPLIVKAVQDLKEEVDVLKSGSFGNRVNYVVSSTISMAEAFIEKLTTKTLTVEELEVGSGDDLYCIYVKNGTLKKEQGSCDDVLYNQENNSSSGSEEVIEEITEEEPVEENIEEEVVEEEIVDIEEEVVEDNTEEEIVEEEIIEEIEPVEETPEEVVEETPEEAPEVVEETPEETIQ